VWIRSKPSLKLTNPSIRITHNKSKMLDQPSHLRTAGVPHGFDTHEEHTHCWSELLFRVISSSTEKSMSRVHLWTSNNVCFIFDLLKIFISLQFLRRNSVGALRLTSVFPKAFFTHTSVSISHHPVVGPVKHILTNGSDTN
jgi:hypothetical protein